MNRAYIENHWTLPPCCDWFALWMPNLHARLRAGESVTLEYDGRAPFRQNAAPSPVLVEVRRFLNGESDVGYLHDWLMDFETDDPYIGSMASLAELCLYEFTHHGSVHSLQNELRKYVQGGNIT